VNKITLKTAILVNKNKIRYYNKLTDVILPKDKLLIKIEYTGICGSQLMEINLQRDNKKFLPHLFGHEAFGKVIRVGESVKKLKPGNKVVLSWIKGKGIDSKGGKLKLNDCTVNYGPITTFSNYSIISETRCFKVSQKFPPLLGAIFGCSILTGFGMVYNNPIPKNKKILVIGAGGIGYNVLLALSSLKIKKNKIYVFEISKDGQKRIKKLGFKNIIYTKDQLKKFKNFFDICYEAAGKVETIEYGFNLINNNGILYFASHPENNKYLKLSPYDFIKGKKIEGVWGGKSNPDSDIKKFYNIIKKNKYLEKFPIKKYNLSQIKNAIKKMRGKKYFKIVLNCDK
jgi:Zn-dependent alcohol dehydrogenase